MSLPNACQRTDINTICLVKVQEEEEEGRYRRAMSLVAKAFRSVSVIGGCNG